MLLAWWVAVCVAAAQLLAPGWFRGVAVYGIRGQVMTYAELQAQIADYLHRTDLSAPLLGFIEKARVRIGRDLRSLEQEATTTLTGPTGAAFTLPAAFMELIRAESDGVPLRSVNPHELAFWESTPSAQVYAIRGREMTVPGATEVFIWYYVIEAKLTSGSTEHPTMAAHPQVWLAASMLEAGLYTADQELLQTWSNVYSSEVAAVNARAKRSRAGTAPATINSGAYSTFGEAVN